MNRVTKRAWIMVVFILVLSFGMGFFTYEYATQANEWVLFSGSPHLGSRVITDRAGAVLLDTKGSRTYASDEVLRRSTLHWLGDRQGNIRGTAISNYAEELSGFDMVEGMYSYEDTVGHAQLTLSASVQNTALQAMEGRKGTVAVYNYKTGEILCAISTPSYDPDHVPDIAGDTSGAYEGVYLNRFTQVTYPPGSIFKIVTTAAALESVEGILDMTFTCRGIYEFGIDRVTCETAHGTKDLKGAMASSCNCCFAQIAQLIGKETMAGYVEKFHITDSIEFDGIHTVAGNYDVSKAAPVELAWSCIGQYTDMINPARYLTFMGAIANGGVEVLPHIMGKTSVEGETTYEAEAEKGERIMSEELALKLQEYMRNNVVSVYGAGNFPGLTVCAKSGTSELGGDLRPNSMFAGYVTDDAYPLAFIAVVENGGYGSSTCVPILSKVLAACKTVMDSE